ncbi:MAG: LacI family transcriptional regulator [candidate division KSB1 bacterium]|nr:LacI family transcriptional regulator [candidate division KSB1 bacterium]
MPKDGRVTIRDLARAANCSQATVSKALNGRADVSPETRERILRLAKEMNYTPHALGRSLRRRVTENVGVVFYRETQPLSGNPFYSRVLEGIEAELAVHGYNLVLHLVQGDDDIPKFVREQQVDGLILVGSMSDAFVARISANDLPKVFVDPRKSVSHASQVLIDNEYGAFIATQYLIRKGHRRIGFISGDLERLSFRQRFEGYKRALQHHGIPLDMRLVQTGGLESGYDHVAKLLAMEDRPTAIFSGNDINAIYGYKAVRDAGLDIPGDVSFVGFDDIELSKLTVPPLTTVRVYKEELGSIAVRQLIAAIAHPDQKPATVIVPTRLIERESVRELP